jgi:hypothetical protein
MRVRVSFTVDATDELRRAISRYYGRTGLASRDEVRQWYVQHGESKDADLLVGYGDESSGGES